jgi:hypothetical protein
MSAAFDLVALRDAYRDETRGGEFAGAAHGHLTAAADALAMALLTLSGERGEDRGDKLGRAEQARGFLIEAVTCLSRARIYNPKIRTLALPTLLATEDRPDGELTRLHQIATRLLWQNHMHLPARLQASPLPPEEEAQLREVFRGVARSARIGRALRHRPTLVALTLLLAGPFVAIPFAHLGLIACVLVLAGWLLGRRREVAPLAIDAAHS